MKILVIQMKFIGDVLATSIICNNLKKIYPNSQIDFLVYPFTKPVIENNPNIDTIVFFEEKNRKSKIELIKFLLKIRKENYDIIIDPTELLRNRDLFFIKNIAAKINFGYNKSNIPLFNKNIDKNSKTMLEVYKEILENLGFSDLNLDYEVPINDASEIRVEEYLKANKISKFVAINFFGASKRRKFKVSKAIDLLGKIQKKYPEYKIIILNSPKDKKTILSIMKIMKENNIYYNEDFKTINDAISLIRKSEIVVSPDTAIVHIAEGLKKDIIAFYSEDKKNYEKWKLSNNEEKNKIHFYDENINNLDIKFIFKEE